MSRVIKKLGIAVILLFVVLTIGLGVLLKSYHPNDFKPLISEKITHLTGRKFHINGDISWSILPWFGIKIDKIVLDDEASSGRSPMLVVGSANIKIELWPLIQKQIRVGDLTLKDVSLQLIHETGQEPNWQGLKSASKESAENNATSPSESHSSSWFSIDRMRVDHFSIQNANIYYRDAKQSYEMQNFGFSSNKFEIGSPIPIQVSFELNSRDNPLRTKHKGSASIEFSPTSHLFSVKDIVWISQIHDDRLPQKDLELQLKTAILYNYSDDTLNINQFNARAGGADISGKLSVSQVSNHSDFTGELKVEGYNPTELMATVRAFTPISLDLESARKFTVVSTLRGDRHTVEFKDFNLQAGKTDANGKMSLRLLEDKNWLTFNLNASQVNMAMFDNKNTNVSSTKINTATVAPKSQAPNTPSTNPAEVKRAKSEKTNWLIAGTIGIQQLILHDLSLQQMKADVHLEKANLQIANVYMNLLGGEISANLKATLNDVPDWALTAEISHLPIRPVLEKLGKKPLAQGNLDLMLTVNTRGLNQTTLIKNSQGNGKFALKSGQVSGVDVDYYLQSAQALADKSFKKTATDRDYTPIKSMAGTFTIVNGVLSNKDLDAQTDESAINGKGQIDLTSQSLDYGVTAVYYKTDTSGAKQKSNGIPLSIRIVGPIDKPKVVPDTQAYLNYFLQQAVKNNAQKLLNNNILNNKIGNELQKALSLPKP